MTAKGIQLIIVGIFFSIIRCNGQIKKDNYWITNECTRSIPKAIVKKNKVQNWSFSIDSIRGIGFEKAYFSNDIQLTIENKGCEYYWVEFTFNQSLGTDAKSQSLKLVDLLKILKNNTNAPFNYDAAITIIFTEYERLKPGAIIDIDEMEKFEILRISENTKVAFYIGPL
ncbi:hypothetical protein QQ008_29315 [Fulvivirgaceae bacterium BMA10]|uniref:Uncharacterized protein n=1 Tax=Splendidivirga corallicola TaxID=3051826 RepID=A0ABT8KXL7_9BACT|nr:hypothetical protein [Fulvivirgaceae bacterium BMA10]